MWIHGYFNMPGDIYQPIPNEARDQAQHVQLANEVIQALGSIKGVSFPDQAAALDYLTSPLVLTDLGGLAKLNACDDTVETVGEDLVKLRTSKGFIDRWSRVLKNQLLTNEYKERISGSSVDLIESRKIIIKEWNAEIDTTYLNTLGMEIADIKSLVRDVVNDQNCAVEQGVFWNVLISKEKPCVIKTERDKLQHEDASRDLLVYSVVGRVFGEKCLPKQAVLKDKRSGQLCVVQERLNLEAMVSLSNGNVDNFIAGKIGQDIREALEHDVNCKKMKKFIDDARLLLKNHNLSIDTSGENVYFNVKGEELEIKIADYGCFEKGKSDNNIEQVESFLKKIESVL